MERSVTTAAYVNPRKAHDDSECHHAGSERFKRLSLTQSSGRSSDVSSGRASDAAEAEGELVSNGNEFVDSKVEEAIEASTASATNPDLRALFETMGHNCLGTMFQDIADTFKGGAIRRCIARETIGMLVPAAVNFAYSCAVLGNLTHGQYAGVAATFNDRTRELFGVTLFPDKDHFARCELEHRRKMTDRLWAYDAGDLGVSITFSLGDQITDVLKNGSAIRSRMCSRTSRNVASCSSTSGTTWSTVARPVTLTLALDYKPIA